MPLYLFDNNTTLFVDMASDSPLGDLVNNSSAIKPASKKNLEKIGSIDAPYLLLIGQDSLRGADTALANIIAAIPEVEECIHKTILVSGTHLGTDDDFVELIGSGFDEVLLAPITQRAFDEKLRRDITHVQNARALRSQLENARMAAFAAITTASDLGRLIAFMDRCHAVQDYDQLSHLTLQLLDTFGLKSTLLLRDEKKEYWSSSHPVFPAIHKDFLNKVEERIFTHKQAISIRFDHCALLVTNAPQHDEVRMGQYRDLLAQIANVLESKVRQIMLFKLIESQHDYMVVVMGLIQKSSTETKEYTASLMRNLVSDLEAEAISLDLTEDQEKRIVALAHRTSDTLDLLLQSNNVLEEHFASLLDTVSLAKNLSTTHKPDDYHSSDDIELF